MVLRPSVHDDLNPHRAAALASQSLMRATNADLHEIIDQTKKIINDSRKAMRRIDAVLRVSTGQGLAALASGGAVAETFVRN